MIVWLASYPRSGNTLLRTVLNLTMGLGSYNDENMQPAAEHTYQASKSYGHLTSESSWDSFYHQASSSKEIFLVKTHLPPRDNQPVIYVVRDGRAATESYAAYHKSFAPDSKFCPSILELMLGDDYYGDWSSHYHMWNSRTEGELLLVRYEELVNADSRILERLRMFVGFEGEVKPFDNPFQKLKLENPDFFRTGHTDWHGGEQWTEKLKYFFIALHGDLLIQLGYIDVTESEVALKKLDQMEVRLLKLANKGFSERNSWHYQAHCKEKFIQQLMLEKQAKVARKLFFQGRLARFFGLNQLNQ